jgi:hypothetical protein
MVFGPDPALLPFPGEVDMITNGLGPGYRVSVPVPTGPFLRRQNLESTREKRDLHRLFLGVVFHLLHEQTHDPSLLGREELVPHRTKISQSRPKFALVQGAGSLVRVLSAYTNGGFTMIASPSTPLRSLGPMMDGNGDRVTWISWNVFIAHPDGSGCRPMTQWNVELQVV